MFRFIINRHLLWVDFLRLLLLYLFHLFFSKPPQILQLNLFVEFGFGPLIFGLWLWLFSLLVTEARKYCLRFLSKIVLLLWLAHPFYILVEIFLVWPNGSLVYHLIKEFDYNSNTVKCPKESELICFLKYVNFEDRHLCTVFLYGFIIGLIRN